MTKAFKKLVHFLLKKLGYELHRHQPVPRTVAPAPPPPSREFIIPKIAASRILNGASPVKMLEPGQVLGNVSLLEMLVLNTLVARLQPSVLFEIGTFDGRTTLNMTANSHPRAQTFTLDLPREGLARCVHALDPHDVQFVDKDTSGRRFLGTPWQDQIVQLWGDSATFDFQPYDGKAGFVFIDGSHAYSYVKNDSEKALHLVTSPAFIVWHDYFPFWTGTVECLEELYLSGGVFADLKHVEETTLVVLPIGISLA